MNINYSDLGGKELAKFSEYIADYLTEELWRHTDIKYNLDRFQVEDAISAYIGGAADHN